MDKLKVSVWVDGRRVTAWRAKTVQHLLDLPFADVGIVQAPPSLLSRIKSLPKKLKGSLFYLYEALDYRVFRCKAARDALERIDVSALSSTPTGAACECDVLVDLTEAGISPALAGKSRFGIWRLCHGGTEGDVEYPPFFQEMHGGTPRTLTRLRVWRMDGTVGTLYRSWTKTHPYSLFLGRNEAFWKSTEFIARCLRDLYRDREKFPAHAAGPDAAERTSARQVVPGPLKMAVFLSGTARRLLDIRREVHGSRNYYIMACRPVRAGRHPWTERETYRKILPPASEFWADPFLFEENGKTWLFFENFLFQKDKGVISVAELSADGSMQAPELVLERDYHLSYPLIFRYREDIYMLPETSGNRTIELYRAEAFPHRWVPDRVLMSGVNAHDPTLFEHNGRYWLFANMTHSGGSCNDELFLFYADTPFGPWQPHPKNPVVSDVSTARPAGRLFRHDGRLIRPSQDCSVRYGYAVNFNHVRVLDEQDYQETLLEKLVPDGYGDYKGLHTYNTGGGFEIIDLSKFVRKAHLLKDPVPEPMPCPVGPRVSQPAYS